MTKEQLAYIDYSQQVSMSKMTLEFGKLYSWGEKDFELKKRIDIIGQLQSLFAYEYGNPLGTDLELLQKIVTTVNSLITGFQLTGTVVIYESATFPSANLYVKLVTANDGDVVLSSIPELNGMDIFSTGGAWDLLVSIGTLSDNLQLHENNKSNPHNVTKSQLGLSKVENTTDLEKPISTATQTALNLKVNATDISEVGYSGEYEDLKSKPFIPTTKADLGLGRVNNTNDLEKPISTATQTALDGKVNKETGKGLSQENYTTAEKAKLASMVNNYRGKFISYAQLSSHVFDPPAQAGNYAVVDAGSGELALTYIYDDSDDVWNPSGGESAGDFATIAGNPYDNPALQTALDDKQDTLGYTPVPETRTVNGKPLDSNINLTASDLGLENEFYSKTEIDEFFSADETIDGYNKANWDDAVTKAHEHSNKAVLDGISSTKVTDWDDAVSKAHTHSNKTFLDSLVSGATVNLNISGNASTVTNGVYTSGNQSINGVKQFNNNPLFVDGISIANLVHCTKAWGGGGAVNSFNLSLTSLFPNFTSIVNGGNNLSVFIKGTILYTGSSGMSFSLIMNRTANKSWSSNTNMISAGDNLISSILASDSTITFNTTNNVYLTLEVTILTV